MHKKNQMANNCLYANFNNVLIWKIWRKKNIKKTFLWRYKRIMIYKTLHRKQKIEQHKHH